MRTRRSLRASLCAILLLFALLFSLTSCSLSSILHIFGSGFPNFLEESPRVEIQPVDEETKQMLAGYAQTYGYDYLGTLEKGEARQMLYRELDAAAMYYHSASDVDFPYKEILYTVNYADLGLTTDEAISVWKTYKDDHPLYYWIAGRLRHNDQDLDFVGDPAYQKGETRAELNAAIYAGGERYLEAIPTEATDYQKALILHDAIIDAIDYAYDEAGAPQTEIWAHSIEGVFLGKGAVCEGFAKAYQLLLTRAGVENLYVTGRSMDEDHAWNVIRVEDEWYGVDITWDDGSEEAPYLYFCISEDEFAKTHEQDLPENTGFSYLYKLPTLAAYSIEWVKVHSWGWNKGIYKNTAEAFAAITELRKSDESYLPSPTYNVVFLTAEEGVRHAPSAFHLYGAFPKETDLVFQGTYEDYGDTFTATRLIMVSDQTITGSLSLYHVVLDAETNVVLRVYGDMLFYGATKRHYSVITEAVTVQYVDP